MKRPSLSIPKSLIPFEKTVGWYPYSLFVNLKRKHPLDSESEDTFFNVPVLIRDNNSNPNFISSHFFLLFLQLLLKQIPLSDQEKHDSFLKAYLIDSSFSPFFTLVFILILSYKFLKLDYLNERGLNIQEKLEKRCLLEEFFFSFIQLCPLKREDAIESLTNLIDLEINPLDVFFDEESNVISVFPSSHSSYSSILSRLVKNETNFFIQTSPFLPFKFSDNYVDAESINFTDYNFNYHLIPSYLDPHNFPIINPSLSKIYFSVLKDLSLFFDNPLRLNDLVPIWFPFNLHSSLTSSLTSSFSQFYLYQKTFHESLSLIMQQFIQIDSETTYRQFQFDFAFSLQNNTNPQFHKNAAEIFKERMILFSEIAGFFRFYFPFTNSFNSSPVFIRNYLVYFDWKSSFKQVLLSEKGSLLNTSFHLLLKKPF